MLLANLLNIQRQDLKKLILFWSLDFLSGMASYAIMCAATSLFLKRVGIEYLPYVYLFNALFLVFISPIYLGLADKMKRGQLYLLSLILFGGLFLAMRICMHINYEMKWVYILLFMFTFASEVLFDSQNWTIIGDSIDPLQGHRLMPIIITGGFVGGVSIGMLLDLFVGWVGTQNIHFVWIIMTGICAFLLFRKDIRDAAWKKSSFVSRGEEKKTRAKEEKLIPFIRKSPLIITMIFFFLSVGAIEYILDYQFNKVMNITFQDEDKLTAFFGVYTAVYSGAIIFFQFFITGRVLSSRGVTLAFVMLPLSQVFGLGLLTISFTFAVAFFASFLYDTVGDTLFDPSYEVVAVAFSHRYRARIKGFLECVVKPLGICLGSAYLILFGNVVHPAITSGVACSIAVLWTLVAFNFKKVFRQTHIKNLFSKNPELVFNAIQSLGERGNVRAVRPLLNLLKVTPKEAFKKNILLTLGSIRDRSVIKTLVDSLEVRNEEIQISAIKALSEYKDYDVTYSLLRFLRSERMFSVEVKINLIFVLSHIVGKSVIPFLMDLLEDADDRIRANTVEAIGILRDRRSIGILRPLLNDPNNRVRANAIVALYRFKRLRREVEKVLKDMYRSRDKWMRISAIYATGRIGYKDLKRDLHKYLDAKDGDVRRNTILALARLGDFHSAEPFIELMIAGRSNESQSMQMVRHLMDFSPPLRVFIIEKISKKDKINKEYLIKILSLFPEEYSDELALLAKDWSQSLF